ncbi:MAG: hypothetical protein Q9212_002875 [Teloschistes hypoglaucus]
MDAPPEYDLCGDLSQSSTRTEHTIQRDVQYTDLPKLPIRRRHLASDMNALGVQFVATMEILKRNIIQRTLCRDQFSKGLRQRHRVMHVHTNPDVSILELYSSLAREVPGFSCSILSIFPVKPGTWELIVKTSCLENLIYACKFALAVKIAEPSNLPPGMVARAAQVAWAMARSGVGPFAQMVPGIYSALLQKYSWNRIMKDTAESFTVQCPQNMIVGECLYIYSFRE